MASVEEIIALLREFPVSEINFEQDGYKVTAVSGPNTYQKPVEEYILEAAAAPGSAEQIQQPQEEKYSFVTATMVGHFHLPNPALKFGAAITLDQYVGNIESIKVMNDVLSQVSGSLVETLVDDGAPVEYGQPLYRLS